MTTHAPLASLFSPAVISIGTAQRVASVELLGVRRGQMDRVQQLKHHDVRLLPAPPPPPCSPFPNSPPSGGRSQQSFSNLHLSTKKGGVQQKSPCAIATLPNSMHGSALVPPRRPSLTSFHGEPVQTVGFYFEPCAITSIFGKSREKCFDSEVLVLKYILSAPRVGSGVVVCVVVFGGRRF